MPEVLTHSGPVLAYKSWREQVPGTGGFSFRHRDYKVINCQSCCFAHLDKLPDKTELKQWYGDKFYGEKWPQYIIKAEFERDYWLAVYGERCRKLINLFLNGKQPLPLEPYYLLDIGSGPGLFLDAAKEAGWKTLAVEPSAQAAQHTAAGHYTYELTFEEFQTEGLIDAINMAFLLEHVIDPAATLKKCHRLLNNGGVICIEVPDDFSPTQAVAEKITKKKEWWVSPEGGHINYFDRKSLTALLERCGFKVEYETGTFDMALFLMAGLDYLGNDQLGRICHTFRMNLETNLLKHDPALKARLYKAMYDAGVTRELLFFARKV